MGTVIRAEAAKSNPYYICGERTMELTHFCLQYRDWAAALSTLDGYAARSYRTDICGNLPGDPVAEIAERREKFRRRMEIVEEAARRTDDVLGYYIFLGVTRGLSYEKLNARDRVPCCKETYYKLRRKFFYILDGLRD